jgi:hypothetical protein
MVLTCCAHRALVIAAESGFRMARARRMFAARGFRAGSSYCCDDCDDRRVVPELLRGNPPPAQPQPSSVGTLAHTRALETTLGVSVVFDGPNPGAPRATPER